MTGTNRLAKEKSPYLLQHAHNPVDWYPWGNEAFEKAQRLDMPIFLSIGYSACHWCHVMEKESFEDVEVAALLNHDFVSIKVDREERPDIDELYMKVSQLMTGGGGWPLTIVMTPDKVPFLAATYVPKRSTKGMMGMMELIPEIVDAWKNRRDDIFRVKQELLHRLLNPPVKGDDAVSGALVDQSTFDALKGSYESAYGGFELQPKFPTPHRIMFLLRYWRRTQEDQALQMARHTLKAMAKGGIHDHVGGGFHRYATDRRWMVPHFEKMLYDQALMAITYGEGYQATKEEWMRDVARSTVDYVVRDLSSPEGAYFASEDADSEGVEGKFYTWTYQEIEGVIPSDDLQMFVSAFDVRHDGNLREGGNGRYSGQNVLNKVVEDDVLASKYCGSAEEAKRRLQADLDLLKEKRDLRVRPGRDEKVLLDWNGLMLAALAKVGRILPTDRLIDRGARLVDFIEKNMRDTRQGLLHRFKDGEAGIPAFLSDHAFYGWGLLEMYQATLDDRYLHLSRGCADDIIEFMPAPRGGFYSSRSDPDIIARNTEAYDGAIPSGNSAAFLLFSDLALLTDDPGYHGAADGIISAFAHELTVLPEAHTFLGMSYSMRESRMVKVSIRPHDAAKLKTPLEWTFLPQMLWYGSADEKLNGSALACLQDACLSSVQDAASLREILEKNG